ncbi:Tripeptidyl-peptidase sed3 [Sparassis crispa]|uniref:tripeptidyl-peptidase II n=1 Tax=Sparassis crispa TaxID=139825 RepID=A0A401GCK2_9APHY|nr:Tripeptidyl-peptidase sed3 [Sparassis crispa]GBE79871.1 Tripeptidyl-peptidase sed3 [Sparassis crispa]
MRSLSAWLLLALCPFAYAAPRGCTHKVKESVPPPRGWTKLELAPANHNIELRIGLPQSNFAELERHLYEVSDPFHERYGEHLSKEEVEALIAPNPESINRVDEWLASHGITAEDFSRSPARDWVKVKVSVSLAEKMLDTKYHVWVHDESGDAVVRTTSYSLPEDLHEHVELVQPTTMFSRFNSLKTTYILDQDLPAATNPDEPTISVPTAYNGSVDASCNGTITVTCLKQLYNAVGYTPSASNGNHIAVTGYLDQYANLEDLQMFYADEVPAAVNTSFTYVSINGGQNNQTLDEAGAEADLDTQFAFGLTFPTPGTFYSTGGSPPYVPDILTPNDTNEPYIDWLGYILNATNPPQTISTSYGDDEQTVPYSYARRVCAEFAQLGARGVSLTFSSGDGGVGDGNPDPATQQCYTNDGRNVTEFLPAFPASCPYVTAVGGTIYVPEQAVFFSGGGVSNYFPRPSWQEDVVANYFDNLAPGTYSGLYNTTGRAYPDVAAQAFYFKIYLSGNATLIGGTSAASPTFAGFVSLLNDARISLGLSPLGYLNPLIYAVGSRVPEAFNDITVGNNPGCGTEGFNATAGWDPVTGFGTPNFANLKALATYNTTAISKLL